MNFDVPSLHDVQLVGASISTSGDELMLSIVDGDLKASIFFGGVKAFRLVDMQIQNIIYGVHAYSGPGVDGEKLRGLLEWVSSSIEAKPYMTDEVVSRYAAKVENGELVLVEVEPSAGAELSVLCEVVEYRKER